MKPRALHITAAPDSLMPPAHVELSAEVLAVTGAVLRVRRPEQGRCNLLQILETETGSYVLKAARGRYRSQELWAEHAAMALLCGVSGVPVPASLAFIRQGEDAIQIRELAPGVPLKQVLAGPERAPGLAAFAQTLQAIHGAVAAPGDWTWEAWADGALAQAERNLRARVIDSEDFPAEPPEAVLAWLHARRPAPGAVTLLHGDYRPKNLLWEGGRVSAVIDWAFADYGDPYYDLAIAAGYAARGAERERFLRAYGLTAVDTDRLRWCSRLGNFINV